MFLLKGYMDFANLSIIYSKLKKSLENPINPGKKVKKDFGL